MASGIDPNTGRYRVARGIIAIGDRAVGVVAIGGAAYGVLALGGFHCLVGIVWLTTYANLVGRLHMVLSRERVRRWLERATGVVLISFGFRVAFSSR